MKGIVYLFKVMLIGLLLVSVTGLAQNLKINEIRHFTHPSSGIGFNHPFVELYNKSDVSLNINEYALLNNQDSIIAILPNWTIPPKSFLTIMFGSGTDDNDFTDREATFYVSISSTIFLESMDALGLYTNSDTSNIIDFVAWSETGSFTGNKAYNDALDNNIWSSNDFVDVSGYGLFSVLGLCPDGYDHNVSSDWRPFDWYTYFVATEHGGPNPIQIAPLDGELYIQSMTPVIEFEWYSIGRANSYQIQIAADSLFTTPIIDSLVTETNFDLPTNIFNSSRTYYWRVFVIDNNGKVEESAIWAFYIIVESNFPPPPSPDAQRLNVPNIKQRKDTKMLCITDDKNIFGILGGILGGIFPHIKRHGCTEMAGQAGPWDEAHPRTHASHFVSGQGRPAFCPHCSSYSGQACIAMINHFFGGNLSQDRISYEAFVNEFPVGKPEGDLGHNVNMKITQVTATLNAVVGAGTMYNAVAPAFAVIMTQINAGKPVMVQMKGGQRMVITDFVNLPNGQSVSVNDPWPGGKSGYKSYKRFSRNIVGWWSIGVPAIVRQVPPINQDTDKDGVVDFDEDNRFCSVSNDADTDKDRIDDKKEIRSYTFHASDGLDIPQHPNILATVITNVNFPDIDGDGDRAECDCDTDNDGDADGDEDTNRNGKGPEADETCVYDKDDKDISLQTNKAEYQVGENIVATGKTFSKNSFYNYYVIKKDCNPLANGTPFANPPLDIVKSGRLNTTNLGEIKLNIGPLPSGEYQLLLDIQNNNIYDEANCMDIFTCFKVIAPKTIIVTKAVSNERLFCPEEEVDYIITVKNTTSESLTNVSIIDSLPLGLEYVSDDFNGSVETDNIIWSIDELAPEEEVNINLKVRVRIEIPLYIINGIFVLEGDEIVEFAFVEICVLGFLDITKTVNLIEGCPGEEAIYTITVSNNGKMDVKNIELVEILPSELTYVTNSLSENYDPASHTWTIPEIRAGETLTFDVTTLIKNDIPLDIPIINQIKLSICGIDIGIFEAILQLKTDCPLPTEKGCCYRCENDKVEICENLTLAECQAKGMPPYQWRANCECGKDLDVGGPCPKDIPTLSEWAIIILVLLLLSISTVSIIHQREPGTLLFQPQIFQRLVIRSLPFILLTFLLITFAEGEWLIRNFIGTLISGGIVTYMIHFFALQEKMQKDT